MLIGLLLSCPKQMLKTEIKMCMCEDIWALNSGQYKGDQQQCKHRLWEFKKMYVVSGKFHVTKLHSPTVST